MKSTFSKRVQTQRRITIPKSIRDDHGLKPEDTIEIKLEYRSKESTIRVRVQKQGRLSIPKPVYYGLELTAGVEVEITVEKV